MRFVVAAICGWSYVFWAIGGAGLMGRLRELFGVVLAARLVVICPAVLPAGTRAAEPAGHKPTANWYIVLRPWTTNDVGCAERVLEKPPAPGEGKLEVNVFKRPPNLDIEALSDAQLDGCGLPHKTFAPGTAKNSVEYKDWLTGARAVMTDGDGPPWVPAALPSGVPQPPPPQRTTLPAYHLRHPYRPPASFRPTSPDASDAGQPPN